MRHCGLFIRVVHFSYFVVLQHREILFSHFVIVFITVMLVVLLLLFVLISNLFNFDLV